MERLYQVKQNYRPKKERDEEEEKLKEEKELKELEQCTFQPKLNNTDISQIIQADTKPPNGFEKTVGRLRFGN